MLLKMLLLVWEGIKYWIFFVVSSVYVVGFCNMDNQAITSSRLVVVLSLYIYIYISLASLTPKNSLASCEVHYFALPKKRGPVFCANILLLKTVSGSEHASFLFHFFTGAQLFSTNFSQNYGCLTHLKSKYIINQGFALIVNNLRKFLWKNVKVMVGDEHPKQLVKWVRASLRNQIFRIIGRMSLESSH